MKRGDKAVLTISAALAAVAIAAVAFSQLVLDRRNPSATPADSDSSLLVVTWGPSLCAVEPANSGCRSGHVEGLGRTFVLHGLWPQPSTEQYCDVPKGVSDRKRDPVQLPDDIRARLQNMMSDPALLPTHEWYAHGTCSGVGAGEYFGVATQLAQQAVPVLNGVVTSTPGGQVSVNAVRQTFDAQFGAGAGQRVGLSCKKDKGGDVVYEVKLSLPPVAELHGGGNVVPLGEALSRGPAIGAGCPRAHVP